MYPSCSKYADYPPRTIGLHRRRATNKPVHVNRSFQLRIGPAESMSKCDSTSTTLSRLVYHQHGSGVPYFSADNRFKVLLGVPSQVMMMPLNSFCYSLQRLTTIVQLAAHNREFLDMSSYGKLLLFFPRCCTDSWDTCYPQSTFGSIA